MKSIIGKLWVTHTYIATVCFFILLLLLSGCKKTPGEPVASNKFSVASAKEWYYGVFRKSEEYRYWNGAEKGKKSPDWENGTLFKNGRLEIAEFPLIKTKKIVLAPKSPEAERIAEASLDRI